MTVRSLLKLGMQSAVVTKHLPGQHNQLDHGRKKFGDIVGRGKVLRYKYQSGSSKGFWTNAAISKNTARQRINELRRMVADRWDLPKDTKVEYWLDWDEYKDNVAPGVNSGSYPLARYEPQNSRIVISPSIARGMFDDNLNDWRVVTHELMHATSDIGEFGLSGPEQVLEEGMAEIASLQLWADEYDLQPFADNHRTISDPLEAMVVGSAYPEHVNNLLMHAADEVGFDREAMGAWMEEKWRSGNYDDYERYQVLDRGLNAEDNTAVRIAEINERADDLIERLPQDAVEYERGRELSITHVTESPRAWWEWETTQKFKGIITKAEAAGIDMKRIPASEMDDFTWEIQEGQMKARHGSTIPTREGFLLQETVSKSFLYWYLSE